MNVSEQLARLRADLTPAEPSAADLALVAPHQFSLADLAPPNWLIEKLLLDGSVLMLSAGSGTGKTWLLCALIAAALTGRAWFDRAVNAERFAILDAENGAEILTARLVALMLGLTGRRDEEAVRACLQLLQERVLLWPCRGLRLNNPAHRPLIERALAEFQPDITIVDTLMSSFEMEDSNSNTEMAQLLTNVRTLATKFDMGVVIAHHNRKASKDRPNTNGEGMLGAGQLSGQAQHHAGLDPRPGTARTYEELADGNRRLLIPWRFTIHKNRRGPELTEDVELELLTDAYGLELCAELRTKGLAVTDDRPADQRRWEDGVRPLMEENGGEMVPADIRRELALSEDQLKKAFAYGVQQDELEPGPTGRGAAGKPRVLMPKREDVDL